MLNNFFFYSRASLVVRQYFCNFCLHFFKNFLIYSLTFCILDNYDGAVATAAGGVSTCCNAHYACHTAGGQQQPCSNAIVAQPHSNDNTFALNRERGSASELSAKIFQFLYSVCMYVCGSGNRCACYLMLNSD